MPPIRGGVIFLIGWYWCQLCLPFNKCPRLEGVLLRLPVDAAATLAFLQQMPPVTGGVIHQACNPAIHRGPFNKCPRLQGVLFFSADHWSLLSVPSTNAPDYRGCYSSGSYRLGNPSAPSTNTPNYRGCYLWTNKNGQLVNWCLQQMPPVTGGVIP